MNCDRSSTGPPPQVLHNDDSRPPSFPSSSPSIPPAYTRQVNWLQVRTSSVAKLRVRAPSHAGVDLLGLLSSNLHDYLLCILSFPSMATFLFVHASFVLSQVHVGSVVSVDETDFLPFCAIINESTIAEAPLEKSKQSENHGQTGTRQLNLYGKVVNIVSFPKLVSCEKRAEGPLQASNLEKLARRPENLKRHALKTVK